MTSITTIFGGCGHSQTEFRNDLGLEEFTRPWEATLPGRYCPECFMKPVPWEITVSIPEPWVIPFRANVRYRPIHFAVANDLWTHAIDIMALYGNDLDALLGENHLFLKRDAVDALKTVEWLLTSEISYRIAHHHTPQPRKAEKTFVLQLMKALQSHYGTRAMTVRWVEQIHRNKLRTLVPEVKRSALKDDELDCTICSQALFEEDEEGKVEPAVKTACGHIFGANCLFDNWLQDNETCPNCRRVLLTLDRKESQLEVIQLVAEMRNTPNWLMQLLGTSPAQWLRAVGFITGRSPIFMNAQAFLNQQNLDIGG